MAGFDPAVQVEVMKRIMAIEHELRALSEFLGQKQEPVTQIPVQHDEEKPLEDSYVYGTKDEQFYRYRR
ncbi:MAG: hypothetical protein BWX84_00042 [Verrucomicrobia bacterium ADurb.Bin118]|nr:MAG: hypothetical protein BWX84_00042 [Verrucomicrobia bacterium ADurb.Bin118]